LCRWNLLHHWNRVVPLHPLIRLIRVIRWSLEFQFVQWCRLNQLVQYRPVILWDLVLLENLLNRWDR
jgi:hypothetical protein